MARRSLLTESFNPNEAQFFDFLLLETTVVDAGDDGGGRPCHDILLTALHESKVNQPERAL